MTSEYIKGPWVARQDNPVCKEIWHVYEIEDDWGFAREICTVFSDGPTGANAKLLSAAPDLLLLAKQYASECGECAGTGIMPDDQPCEECKFIRNVIANAEGQS